MIFMVLICVLQVYLTLADDDLKEKLFNKCCTMLEESKDGDTMVLESILDIVRVLIPYQSVETLKTFFDSRISEAKQMKHFKEEKKYFRYCIHFNFMVVLPNIFYNK